MTCRFAHNFSQRCIQLGLGGLDGPIQIVEGLAQRLVSCLVDTLALLDLNLVGEGGLRPELRPWEVVHVMAIIVRCNLHSTALHHRIELDRASCLRLCLLSEHS